MKSLGKVSIAAQRGQAGQNGQNGQNGMTLIELILGTALVSILIMAVASLNHLLLSKSIVADRKADATMAIDRAISVVSQELVNSAVLPFGSPVGSEEPLVTGEPELYRGLHGIYDPNFAPECMFDTTNPDLYSIVRTTTLQSQYRPERLTQKWSESEVVSSATTKPAHITSSPNWPSLYHYDGNSPVDAQEVFLIDADLRYWRRYEVKGFDRYQVQIDGIDYTRTRLNLEMPLSATRTGNATTTPINPNIAFVTGSIMFASRTQYVCVEKKPSGEPGRLISVSTLDTVTPNSKIKVLFDPAQSGLKITKMEVTFHNGKATESLSGQNFGRFPTSMVDQLCQNFAKITLEVKSTKPTEAGLPGRSLSKIVLLSNRHKHRLKGCDAITP